MGEQVCIDLKIQGSNNGKDIRVNKVTMEKPGTYPHDGTAATASFAYPHDEINFPASGVLTQEDILRQGEHTHTHTHTHTSTSIHSFVLRFRRGFVRSRVEAALTESGVCVCTRGYTRVCSADNGCERLWETDMSFFF